MDLLGNWLTELLLASQAPSEATDGAFVARYQSQPNNQGFKTQVCATLGSPLYRISGLRAEDMSKFPQASVLVGKDRASVFVDGRALESPGELLDVVQGIAASNAQKCVNIQPCTSPVKSLCCSTHRKPQLTAFAVLMLITGFAVAFLVLMAILVLRMGRLRSWKIQVL